MGQVSGVSVLLWDLPHWTAQHCHWCPLRSAQRSAQAAAPAAEGNVQLHFQARLSQPVYFKGDGEREGSLCACTEWEGNLWYLWSYSDFQWQLSTIYRSTLGFPPLRFTSTVLLVMSPLCQDDQVLHPCPQGFSCQPQHRALLVFHELIVHHCFRMCSAVICGIPTHTIKKAERVALECLKHSICASPSSLDRHSQLPMGILPLKPKWEFILHMPSVVGVLE